MTVPPVFPNSNGAVRPLDVFFTYDDQPFFLPSVPNDGTVIVGYINIAPVPPGAWWNVVDPYNLADGAKVEKLCLYLVVAALW